jgi:ribosomal-protein-alanine acetyltransferase
VTIKAELARAPDINALSAIHKACFYRGWEAGAIAEMLEGGAVAFVAYPPPERGRIKEGVIFYAESVDPVPPPSRGRGIIGFGIVRIVADEAEIRTIAVEERSRRKGAGRAIARAMLAFAGAQAARQVFLEVRKSNAAAIALYESLGFKQLSLRKEYYSNPDGSREDATLMCRVF